MLTKLHIRLPLTPLVLCDNLSVPYTCRNPIFHNKIKHLVLDFFFVLEKVANKEIIVQHIPSIDQLTDLLTNPLTKNIFLLLLNEIGVADGSPILRVNIKSIS